MSSKLTTPDRYFNNTHRKTLWGIWGEIAISRMPFTSDWFPMRYWLILWRSRLMWRIDLVSIWLKLNRRRCRMSGFRTWWTAISSTSKINSVAIHFSVSSHSLTTRGLQPRTKTRYPPCRTPQPVLTTRSPWSWFASLAAAKFATIAPCLASTRGTIFGRRMKPWRRLLSGLRCSWRCSSKWILSPPSSPLTLPTISCTKVSRVPRTTSRTRFPRSSNSGDRYSPLWSRMCTKLSMIDSSTYKRCLMRRRK